MDYKHCQLCESGVCVATWPCCSSSSSSQHHSCLDCFTRWRETTRRKGEPFTCALCIMNQRSTCDGHGHMKEAEAAVAPASDALSSINTNSISDGCDETALSPDDMVVFIREALLSQLKVNDSTVPYDKLRRALRKLSMEEYEFVFKELMKVTELQAVLQAIDKKQYVMQQQSQQKINKTSTTERFSPLYQSIDNSQAEAEEHYLASCTHRFQLIVTAITMRIQPFFPLFIYRFGVRVCRWMISSSIGLIMCRYFGTWFNLSSPIVEEERSIEEQIDEEIRLSMETKADDCAKRLLIDLKSHSFPEAKKLYHRQLLLNHPDRFYGKSEAVLDQQKEKIMQISSDWEMVSFYYKEIISSN